MTRRSALPLALLIAGVARPAAAQGVELTGTYVDYVAIGANGVMLCSTTDCGAGHSMRYREESAGPPSCDLYTPGSAHESFTVEVATAGGPLRFTNTGLSASGTVTRLAGPTIDGRAITWSGRAASGAVDVRVDQRVELEADERFVRMTITLTNQGTSTLTDVYYLRNGDPDLGQCSIGSLFQTENDVVRQPPTDEVALATIAGGDGASAGRRLVLGLGAHDARARVHNGGFTNVDASGIWAAPTDGAGAAADEAVDIVFRESGLAPGASTELVILYVWGPDEATVETRFDELGFPTAPCVGLAELDACTTARGDAGLCRAGRCCTGCWDGGRCRAGGSASRCGLGGGACADCADGDPCTSDVCAAGACANPDAPEGTRCDDGLFCTAFDTCDGAGTCGGTGDTCDDRQSCTVDACDEDADRCSNVGLADGTACTGFGQPGQCRASACCTGCFDGSVCRGGTAASACGQGGATCADCRDGDACTTDRCVAGACQNPDAPAGTRCDDGLFCTATDVCDGAGACLGAGDPCDDRQSCTTDTCDEAADACGYLVTSGCIIGGECVETDAENPTYPCQVCDPMRDDTDWSPRIAGTRCGGTRCSLGRILTRSCDAAGACAPDPPTDCESGLCAADGVSCGAGCEAGGCGEAERCDPITRRCVPRRAAGSACGGAEECLSGVCVDGVCCGSPCEGVCERCDQASSPGTCAPIRAGRDPDDECPGACDGAGACAADAGVPRADAGRPSDAGPSDAGPADAAPPRLDAALIPGIDAGFGRDDAGCACRAGRGGAGGPAVGLLLVLGLAWRRRRRG